MKMLMYGLSKIETSDAYSLLNYLYNKPIQYSGGEMILLQNNYIASTIYAFEFNGNDNEGDKKYTIDISKYFEAEEIMGYINENSCNFLLSINGTKKNDYIAILMIQSVNGERYVENIYLRRLLIYLVDNMNEEGGINGKEIKIVYVNINSDIDSTVEEINDKIEKYNIGSGFIVCTSEERKKITKEVDEDFLFFYLGFTEGGECQKNVIFV